MRSFFLTLAAVLVASVLGAPAVAQEKTDPDEITVGVARFTLSMPYASVRVNGEEWEHSYFEEDGHVLVLEGMDRTAEYVLHLVPMEEDYKVEDLAVAATNWKLARLDRQTRQWQFTKKITFRKWEPGEREEWEKRQEEAAEEPESEELPPEEMVTPDSKPSKVDDAPAAIEEAPEERPADERPVEEKPAEEKPAAPVAERPVESPEKPAESVSERPAE